MSEFISSIGRGAGGFFNFDKPNDFRAGSIVTCAFIGAYYFLNNTLETRCKSKPDTFEFPFSVQNTFSLLGGAAAGAAVGAFAPITVPAIAVTIISQAGIKGIVSKTP